MQLKFPNQHNSKIKKNNEQISIDQTPDPFTIIIATGVSFAVLTGLAEFAFLLIANYFLHRFIYYWGAYLLWMIPLAELIVFSFPAIILSLVAWRWPKAVSLRLVVGVFAFLGFLSLLLLYKGLQPIAALILAVGLAVQASRMAGSNPQLYYRLLRYSMGWIGFLSIGSGKTEPQLDQEVKTIPTADAMTRKQFLFSAGTTVAALALGVSAADMLVEKLLTLNLSTPRPKSPNVLLIVLDTVRAKNLSLYGYPRATSPQLEKLAKSAIVFDQAVATASWTLPSHASMFTGRFPHELSVSWDSGLNRAYPTLAELLSANGYSTAGFVSNVWYCSRESGLNRGFDHYEDFTVSLGQIMNSSSMVRTLASEENLRRTIRWYNQLGRKPAPEMNSDFLRWLKNRDRSRPYFAFINYFDAHGPYLPPKPYDSRFGPRISRQNPLHSVGWHWTPNQIEAEMDAYDGAIAYLDHHIGVLFNELQNLGELENTLVILTSDHGEEFLEHGFVSHGYSLYWPSLHVLLMLSYPGRLPTGLINQEAVSLRDLPATVLDMVGLQNQGRLPGKSLRRFWEKSPGTQFPAQSGLLSEVGFTPGYPRWYPISRGDIKSLILERLHYIKNGDDSEELYDIESDPLEKTNLAHLPTNQTIIQSFRKELEAIL